VWIPILSYCLQVDCGRRLTERGYRSVELVGQLAEGANLGDAQAEFDLISERLEAAHPDANSGLRVLLRRHTAMASGVGPIRLLFRLLLVVAGLLLVVISANVANLTLFRSITRQHEVAVRQSLGAPLTRLLRLPVVEGLLLAIVASFVGWWIARWTAPLLLSLIPTGAPNLDLSPDPTVAVYVLLQASLVAVTFALFPAFRIWRRDPSLSLKSRVSEDAPPARRLLKTLTVIQVTASIILLTGNGLLLRSATMLERFDSGFDHERLLLVTADTRGVADNGEASALIVADLGERLRTVRGLKTVSYANYAPLSRRSMSLGLVQAKSSQRTVQTDFNLVGPVYAPALGVPLVLGRDVTVSDGVGALNTVVISENLASELWPGQSALGGAFRVLESDEPFEVVGVVADAAFADVQRGSAAKMVFLPFVRRAPPPGEVIFHLRHAGSLAQLVPAIRYAVYEFNPSLPIVRIETAEQRLESLSPTTFLAVLTTVFAVGALVLAAIGLYGLSAVNMTRRTREFGVRIALGASSTRIWVEALRSGVTLIAIVLPSGIIAGTLSSRALESVLFGVEPTDWISYVGVAVVATVTCLAACALPALRASRTDPVAALRQE
jgi:predicted permease